MISEVIAPVVRRAVLDFLDDVGGEHNDDVLTLQLNALAHRVARRDVRQLLQWLGERGLVELEELGPYLVAEITPDGRDVAAGNLRVDGVSRHKTGA